MNQPLEIELVASSRKKDVAETAAILKEKGIPFETDVPKFETRPTRVIGKTSGPKYFLMVASDDFLAAWNALESEYAKVELPEDHYLLDSDDDELSEILEEPRKWSPFDTAHAKILAKERGIDVSGFDQRLLSDASEAAGQKHNRSLVISGIFILFMVLYLISRFLRSSP